MTSPSERLSRLEQRVSPTPNPMFLAYARQVVAFGGGDPMGEAAVDLARWLDTGRRDDPNALDQEEGAST